MQYCRSEELVEPQLSALAKLCAYCIYATSIANNTMKTNSLKRTRSQMDSEVSK